MAVSITLRERPLGTLRNDRNNLARNVSGDGNFEPPFSQQFKTRSKDNPCYFCSSAVTIMKMSEENQGSYQMLKERVSDVDSLKTHSGDKKEKSYPSRSQNTLAFEEQLGSALF